MSCVGISNQLMAWFTSIYLGLKFVLVLNHEGKTTHPERKPKTY